jgi:predicted helicase
MTALVDLLDDYMFRSESETERDEKFEELMKAFLRTDDAWAAQFDAVWSWDEWPGREGPGNGIDLVAREHDTENLVAVQCAFHDPAQPLSKPEIDPFLSASNKPPFTARLVVATTDSWHRELEDAVQAQEIPVARVGLTQMLDSSVDWARFGGTRAPAAAGPGRSSGRSPGRSPRRAIGAGSPAS